MNVNLSLKSYCTGFLLEKDTSLSSCVSGFMFSSSIRDITTPTICDFKNAIKFQWSYFCKRRRRRRAKVCPDEG